MRALRRFARDATLDGGDSFVRTLKALAALRGIFLYVRAITILPFGKDQFRPQEA